ncbi:MAG TPA: hypothetical protein VL752_08360, partial [Acidisoma sp.]|uniref:hypothetical protein n=1 Tax=Acidisoma sp. TaxID=1872115 RepID=UPI002C837285
MADQSDVESALTTAIAAALYPNGTTAMSALGDVTFRIYRGWPVSQALGADLAAGIVNISVFPTGEPRETTRYMARWHVTTATAPTLTPIIRSNIVTFSGTPQPGQMAGMAVNGETFVYLVQKGDTAALVAASLAAQITAAGHLAQYSNATIALPGAASLLARVEQAQNAFRETRRQSQSFRVSCWCPTPALRDQTCAAIDTALANTSFLTLADETAARLTLAGGSTIDQMENATLYRRDLLYAAEYATVLTAAQPAMVFGTGTLSTPAG